MSEAMILEFKGVGFDQYKAVNEILGVEGHGAGGGDWPEGLIAHTAGLAGDSFVVFEIWESQAAQGAFMESRLGPALGQVGLPEPVRVEWFSVVGQKA
jgi:hypothetical protein